MSSARPVVPYFELQGQVDKQSVSATWSDDCLTADPELWDRAEVLVASGETVATTGKDLSVRANLSLPYSAALTLIRCFDSISRAKVMFSSDEENEGARTTIELLQQTPT